MQRILSAIVGISSAFDQPSFLDQGILIVDERIQEVGPLSVIQSHAPKDVAVIDLTHFRVLPELIDAHTHLLKNNYCRMGHGPNLLMTVTQMSTVSRALLGAAMGRQDLEAGITTVRDARGRKRPLFHSLSWGHLCACRRLCLLVLMLFQFSQFAPAYILICFGGVRVFFAFEPELEPIHIALLRR
jgi:hypothetical protein